MTTTETEGIDVSLSGQSARAAGTFSKHGGSLRLETGALELGALASFLPLGEPLRGTLSLKALLAVVQNKDAARLMGINVRLAIASSFALSTALAALAGRAILAGRHKSPSPTLSRLFCVKYLPGAGNRMRRRLLLYPTRCLTRRAFRCPCRRPCRCP